MTITNVGSRSALNIQSIVDMSTKLSDLQRQLGTGNKADTYSGLGLDRGLTVGLRSQLAATSGYSESMTMIGTRLGIAQTTLTQLDNSVHTIKTSALASAFVINQNGQTTDQFTANNQLDQMLSLLNTRVGDQYIYSGKSPD